MTFLTDASFNISTASLDASPPALYIAIITVWTQLEA